MNETRDMFPQAVREVAEIKPRAFIFEPYALLKMWNSGPDDLNLPIYAGKAIPWVAPCGACPLFSVWLTPRFALIDFTKPFPDQCAQWA